ncbi:hypothetical protein O5D80_001743 [Batrachochytrium dendrobatidis]|nr:hypothetical protein O5D80_001743 [Batrachochytrium dendrobatidis]
MVAAGGDSAEASSIKIYARIRPQRPNSKLKTTPGRYWISSPPVLDASDPHSRPRLGFLVPRDETAGLINNQKESFVFKFDRLFDMDVKQEEVFDTVAKPVIESSLQGYNGTIFAYGQTGSGKTFTITGGAERYADRGLIPRTIQFMFKEAQKNTHVQYTFHISYLEIYNEIGYDLLDSTRDAKKLEDLPKVTMQEDADEMVHLRNLSVVQTVNEEEALNLLFVGDTNRMIAETPSNPSSSRSHCIFIIGVTTRVNGEDVIRKSKLHLVDLAGSERVGRTGIDGALLREAKHINLSLHYLEQVIVALHEHSLGKRSHIPYRNSMMTSVLRDSLGGNCKTTMIATVAVEDPLIDESISTCRFAQRVALISNNATLNEELDPQLVIQRLRQEIARLKAELAIARGETGLDDGETLPSYELERVKQTVDDFLANNSTDATIIMTDFRKIQHAFNILKSYIKGTNQSSTLNNSVLDVSSATRNEISEMKLKDMTINDQGLNAEQIQQFEKLKVLVAHRDNEINILVGMIAQLKAQLEKCGSTPSIKEKTIQNQSSTDTTLKCLGTPKPTTTVQSMSKLMNSNPDLASSIPSLSTEKANAFEIFRREYPASEWIDGQKSVLKEKYAEAKSLGEHANTLRTNIKSMKEQLENPINGDADTLRILLSENIKKYKQAYQQLKDLKLEIEHLQHLLEQARHRLTRDFEHWYINVYFSARTSFSLKQDSPASMSESKSVNSSMFQNDGPMTAPAAGALARQSLMRASLTDAADYAVEAKSKHGPSHPLHAENRPFQTNENRKLHQVLSSEQQKTNADRPPSSMSTSTILIPDNTQSRPQGQIQQPKSGHSLVDVPSKSAWSFQNHLLTQSYSPVEYTDKLNRDSSRSRNTPIDRQSIYSLERQAMSLERPEQSRNSSRQSNQDNSISTLPLSTLALDECNGTAARHAGKQSFRLRDPEHDVQYKRSMQPSHVLGEQGNSEYVSLLQERHKQSLRDEQHYNRDGLQDDIAAFYSARQGVAEAFKTGSSRTCISTPLQPSHSRSQLESTTSSPLAMVSRSQYRSDM